MPKDRTIIKQVNKDIEDYNEYERRKSEEHISFLLDTGTSSKLRIRDNEERRLRGLSPR